jgi:hypothetical protein
MLMNLSQQQTDIEQTAGTLNKVVAPGTTTHIKFDVWRRWWGVAGLWSLPLQH